MVWIVPFLSSNVEPCEFTQSFIKSVSIHTYSSADGRKKKIEQLLAWCADWLGRAYGVCFFRG